jgi:hypothetical protein
LCERTLGSTAEAERRAGNFRQPLLEWKEFPALASAPAVEPRVHINGQDTNFRFEKLLIINGNN